ncbi:MAG: PrsW family glutamic-type intramembrane protease [Verrucomicrobiota bacterium]
MTHGWRSRLHYWSRRRDVLKKLSVGIVLGAFFISWAIVRLTGSRPAPSALVDPIEQSIRNEWLRLRQVPDPAPRDLTHWLRKLMPSLPLFTEALEASEAPGWPEYQRTGKVLAYEIRPLLAKHLPDATGQKLAEDYIAACLAEKELVGKEAATRVRTLASQEKPPAHANELHASLMLRIDRDAEALAAMMREGMLFEGTAKVRETAVRLALNLKDADALRRMNDQGWLASTPPILEHEAGVILGDLGMQWTGLFKHRLESLPFSALLLTLMAAALWYVLLVQHAPKMPWRWSWPIAPIVAGIASIWPTVSMIAWQEDTLGINEEMVSFPYDLWHLIIGVGFREEFCKLALAAFFMPWLLHRRSPSLALMTGAFVGLGFALEENVDYYQDYGSGVALTRFLSANFMHVACTGLTTQALYEMLRSRFGHAQHFIITFATVVTAHAVYDYDAPQVTGLSGYLPMLVLAMLAWQFWDVVEAEHPHARQTISPAAIFLVGSSVVIAISLILTAVRDGDWPSVLAAATNCVSILPVAVIYWRRFEGGLSAR